MIGFSLQFEPTNSAQPLYVQLYEHIRAEILNGRLVPENKLPSARKLSEHLCISRNTVNAAYTQLLSEGYIMGVERSGYFVSSDIDAAFLDYTSIVPHIQKSHPKNKISKAYGFDFRHGKVDAEDVPRQLLKKIMTRCLDDSSTQWASYGDPQGEYTLRAEISKYIHHARGVICTPEQIVITSGTQQSIDLICKMSGSRLKTIAVEEPGYLGGSIIFKLNDVRTIPVGMDVTGMDMLELQESGSDAVMVTPSHQFPSGIIMPVSKRIALLRWAEEHDGLIIENDYEGDLNYVGKPIPCLQSFDHSDRTFYLYSFSNVLFPSIRTSFFVMPKHMMDVYHKRISLVEQTVPTLIQKTLELFISEGHFERQLRKIKKKYATRYADLIAAIEQNLSDGATIIGNSAGMHVLLEVHNQMSEQQLIDTAADHGVKVYPSSQYWIHPSTDLPTRVMLGFGDMDANDLSEGMALLKLAWFTTIKIR